MAIPSTTRVAQLPNFRALPGQCETKLFRSAALIELGSSGQQTLAEYGIECVLDLREPYEIASAPNEIGNPVYLNVPLYRGQVPLDAAIDDVYRYLVLQRGHQIVAAITTIAQYLPKKIVVHCKAGKDRTGLIVALMLAAADIPTEDIITDYEKSAANLSAAYRHHIIEQIERQLANNPDGKAQAIHLHTASPGTAIQRALSLVTTTFGSVERYLRDHGASQEHLEQFSQHFAQRRA